MSDEEWALLASETALSSASSGPLSTFLGEPVEGTEDLVLRQERTTLGFRSSGSPDEDCDRER